MSDSDRLDSRLLSGILSWVELSQRLISHGQRSGGIFRTERLTMVPNGLCPDSFRASGPFEIQKQELRMEKLYVKKKLRGI